MDYITMRGDLSFSQDDFNCVDGLILSQIAYNNLEGLVSPEFKEKITLKDLAQSFTASKDYEKRCNMGAMINPLTTQLLLAAAGSRRFGQIKLSAFINKIDRSAVEQFSAITYELEKNRYLLAMRGTDDTIVGWYEDFNLGYMDEIPAQKDSCLYVNQALTALKGTFMLAGHSKGGNLSVKAAMSFPKKALARLESVYNYDGPGFFAPVYASPEFLQIEGKVHSYFPEFCVVGMTFEHTKDYKIVNCSAEGILQHDPFSWNVKGPAFETLEAFDQASEFFHSSFNTWAVKLSAEERKKFIDTLFDVIYASGASTNYEIDQNKIICGGKMLAKLAELNEAERNSVIRAVKTFVKVAKDNIPMFSAFKPVSLLK